MSPREPRQVDLKPVRRDISPESLAVPEAIRVEGPGVSAEILGRNQRIRNLAQQKLDRFRRKIGEAVKTTRTLRVGEIVARWNKEQETKFSYEDYERLIVMGPNEITEDEQRFADYVHNKAAAIDDIGETELYLAFLESTAYDDAAEQVALEGKAYTSEKTGLINKTEAIRNRFDILRRNFLMEKDPQEVVVVIELDIVNLKALNNQFGDTNVDQYFMNELGRRFRFGVLEPQTKAIGARNVLARLRSEDIVSQLGGDELQVIARTNRLGINKLMELVANIVEAQPFDFDGESVPVKVRIGAEVHEASAVEQMNTTDAQAFVARLRERPLKMAKYVKFMSGSGSQLWSPDVDIPKAAEEEILLDTAERGTGAVAAYIREKKGEEAYQAYRDAIKHLTRQHLN